MLALAAPPYVFFVGRPPTKRAPVGALYTFGGGNMSRVAVFVDAGYLFAQGSSALSGSRQPRKTLSLNETAVMAELIGAASAKCPAASLLRVYWYDGALGASPTLEQATLARMDHVKLRLGFVTGAGRQKGV